MMANTCFPNNLHFAYVLCIVNSGGVLFEIMTDAYLFMFIVMIENTCFSSQRDISRNKANCMRYIPEV